MNEPNFDTRALRRNVAFVLALAAVALVVHNIFGQNGLIASRQQEKELRSIQRQIGKLKKENDKLDQENRALRSDPASLECEARRLGLVKPGEKVYKMQNKGFANPAPAPCLEIASHP
jgi:cell division protein FtsB